jgi:hypothetical protein
MNWIENARLQYIQLTNLCGWIAKRADTGVHGVRFAILHAPTPVLHLRSTSPVLIERTELRE